MSRSCSCLSTEFSSNIQIFLLAYGSYRCTRLDHHVLHYFSSIRFDCHRYSHGSHCYSTSTRFSSSIMGFDFPSSYLSSSPKVSSLARSPKRTREILASTNPSSRCQSTFIDSSHRICQRYEKRRFVHLRSRETQFR